MYALLAASGGELFEALSGDESWCQTVKLHVILFPIVLRYNFKMTFHNHFERRFFCIVFPSFSWRRWCCRYLSLLLVVVYFFFFVHFISKSSLWPMQRKIFTAAGFGFGIFRQHKRKTKLNKCLAIRFFPLLYDNVYWVNKSLGARRTVHSVHNVHSSRFWNSDIKSMLNDKRITSFHGLLSFSYLYFQEFHILSIIHGQCEKGILSMKFIAASSFQWELGKTTPKNVKEYFKCKIQKHFCVCVCVSEVFPTISYYQLSTRCKWW